MTNEERRTQIQGEINALKSLLRDSDYSILKTLEGLLDCTSATGIISFFKTVATELIELKVKRQQWRDKINELEAEEATLDDEANEVTADEATAGDETVTE